MVAYANPVIDPAQYGPSLAVAPPSAVSESNPLGLTAAAPGYLPPELRAPKRDPDMQVTPGSYTPTGLGQPTLTPDQINGLQKNADNWDNMDAAYWKPRLQSPTPILLAALAAAAAPFALGALGVGGAAGAGAGAGAAGAGSAGAAGAGALGAGAATGAGALGAGALGGATVSELVVSAAASGLSIPAIAAAVGIPAATVGSILANSSGSNSLVGSQGSDTVTPPSTDVSEVVVNGVKPPPVNPLAVALPAVAGLGGLAALGGGGGTPAAIGDYAGAGVPSGVPAATGSNAGLGDLSLGNGTATSSLTEAIKSGNPASVGDWIKANPLQAAQLGLLAAGALGGAKSGGGSTSGVSGAGTLASLNPVFSASLPAPTMPARAQSALPQGVNWNRYAIDYPAQSFFSNVPQSGPPQFAVMTRPQTQQNAADRLGYTDIAALRKAFSGKGYAKGGDVRTDFAVTGPGTGRSDSIDAKLSDGEYVMDAESVAMLGDGSGAAGAKKLDRLRVNLRKAKGKSLARGRISVSAKDPEHYMSGGRV